MYVAEFPTDQCDYASAIPTYILWHSSKRLASTARIHVPSQVPGMNPRPAPPFPVIDYHSNSDVYEAGGRGKLPFVCWCHPRPFESLEMRGSAMIYAASTFAASSLALASQQNQTAISPRTDALPVHREHPRYPT